MTVQKRWTKRGPWFEKLLYLGLSLGSIIGTAAGIQAGTPCHVAKAEIILEARVESCLLPPRDVFDIGRIGGYCQGHPFCSVDFGHDLHHRVPPRIQARFGGQHERKIVQIGTWEVMGLPRLSEALGQKGYG